MYPTYPIYLDRIQWERKYYRDLTTPYRSSIIECKLCKANGSVIISDFIDHLREIHNITEITDYDILVQEFTIREEEFTAECRICNSSIDYEMYGVYLLKNHWEIYHGNSSHIYKTIAETECGRDVLDEYIIMGSEATCTKCDRKMNMGNSDSLNAVKLFGHFLSHGYEEKCFIFAKTCKNRFCFTWFVSIIS